LRGWDRREDSGGEKKLEDEMSLLSCVST